MTRSYRIDVSVKVLSEASVLDLYGGRIPVLPLARRFHIVDTVCVFQGIKNKVSILAQLSPDENHPGNAGNEISGGKRDL
jgi:hypothetical protein